ncbi:hypothetical protein [Caudoviricetes sp.]|nr:hypothetical protein [Caudoviricetes sp.]
MPNLSDYGDPTKYNARIAQANADQQAAQHQAQVQTNQTTGQTVGAGMKMAAPVPQNNALLNEAKTVYAAQPGQQTVYQNPGVPGQIGSAQNIDQGQIALDAYNRLLRSGLDPATAAAKLNSEGYKMDVRSAFTAAQPGIIDISGLKPLTTAGVQETAQDFEARKASIAQQNTENLKQQQITQDNAKKKAMESAASSAATSQASGESSKDQTQGGGMQEIGQTVNTLPPSLETALAGLPPEEAAAIRASVLAEMQSSAEAKKQAGLNYADEITAADASQTAYGKVLDQLAKDSADTKAQIETFLEQSQQTREETLAKQQKSAQDQLSFQENKATRELRKANDKRINQLITSQALGGGFGSSNWNAEVSEAQWNGEQAIADLTTEFGFKRADLDIAYTEQFNTIHEYFGSQKLDALKAHRAEMQQIGQYRFTSTEKTEERKNTAKQNFRNTLAGIAKEHATAIKESTKEILRTIDTNRDNIRLEEKAGWDRLESAIKTYGSYVPTSLLESIGKQLPGVNVSEIAQTMTLAQMKQFKIKSMGGGGGSTIGSYDITQVPTQGQVFSDITPNQLREAVDRITLNFGGTGKERDRKRSEYLKRINSGENTASIMASMQNDYWASQKGAPRTAHDGRTEAQASAESLQSFVDFYSIGSNDDGPLGHIDSRVEGFKSLFGQSSEEYNNLANNVGNIRARIIKENYGAAVTPQELAIAKSYIPDMTDKGSIFVTKLQNLKAYNAYLDAKVFAANAGLPPPKPPVPVSLTGTAVSGAGKYSTTDINSILNN